MVKKDISMIWCTQKKKQWKNHGKFQEIGLNLLKITRSNKSRCKSGIQVSISQKIMNNMSYGFVFIECLTRILLNLYEMYQDANFDKS